MYFEEKLAFMKKSSWKMGLVVFFFIIILIASGFSIWNNVFSIKNPYINIILIPVLAVFGILFLSFLASWFVDFRKRKREL